MKAKLVKENLKFSDGEEFDTSGPLRTEERYDGWYVIGDGKLIPVKDEEEAYEMFPQLKPVPEWMKIDPKEFRRRENTFMRKRGGYDGPPQTGKHKMFPPK